MCSSHDSHGERAAELACAQHEVAQSIQGLQRYFVSKDQNFVLDRRLMPPECPRSFVSPALANRAFLDLLVAGNADAWHALMSHGWKLHQDAVLMVNHLDDLENMLLTLCRPTPLNSVDDTAQGRFG